MKSSVLNCIGSPESASRTTGIGWIAATAAGTISQTKNWLRSTKELAAINERTGNNFDYGYCFLDEDGGTEGLIRLEAGDANPKWSFWKEGDSLRVDLA